MCPTDPALRRPTLEIARRTLSPPAMTSSLVIVVFFLLTHGCLCLKDVVLWLPEAVRSGSSLQLSCQYDLEGAALYSIKFYQGDQEFYRFVPKESPPTRVFPLPGVQVDIYQSNSTVVTLNNVQRELTGLYKCEVSADAPLFHTVIRSAYVVVTVEPGSVPELTVEKTKYTLGERIRANCTSRSAFPAANLTFFINNMQVSNTEVTRLSLYVEAERTGLETSVLELEAVAVPVMFRRGGGGGGGGGSEGGRLRLRCLATQYSLYTSSSDLFLQEDAPQLAHVLGPSSPHQPADIVNGVSPSKGCSAAVVVVVVVLGGFAALSQLNHRWRR